MHEVLRRIRGVVLTPVASFEEIAAEKPVGSALVIVVAVSLLGGYEYQLIHQPASDMLPFEPTLLTNTAMRAGMFLVTALGIFLLTRILTAIFEPSGDFLGLLAALGFAEIPGAFSLPANLASRFGGTAGSMLGSVLPLAVSLWGAVLAVVAIRESLKISTGLSLVAYIITTVAVFLLSMSLWMPMMLPL